MNSKLELGRRGEQIASRFLVSKGYKIIDKNYHAREGEIDIIASYFNMLVFVEVKTRSSNQFGTGEESVSDQKLDKLVMTAQKYLQVNNLEERKWQIDLVIVEFLPNPAPIDAGLNKKQPQIRHVENITF